MAMMNDFLKAREILHQQQWALAQLKLNATEAERDLLDKKIKACIQARHNLTLEWQNVVATRMQSAPGATQVTNSAAPPNPSNQP
jgi:hypothetical protein